MQHGSMGAWQPDISNSFFEASIFKLFINAGCWATWELKNDADLKSHFTPLHFVRPVTERRFPKKIHGRF
jgi:hypothetical protein